MIISNHNNLILKTFYASLYNKLQIFLTHHVHFTLFMCAKIFEDLKF
jgi:hypothetical protein